MDIRAAEISAILKEQIKNFGQEAEVSEVGQVLSVGDGIARVYGCEKVMFGELLEFPGGVFGLAMNLADQRASRVDGTQLPPLGCLPNLRGDAVRTVQHRSPFRHLVD